MTSTFEFSLHLREAISNVRIIVIIIHIVMLKQYCLLMHTEFVLTDNIV